MPDLLHLRSYAVRNPELYKQEVMAQKYALAARVELFKLQPYFQHYEMVELFYFLQYMSSLYEELKNISNDAVALIAQFGAAMHVQTRESLLKLAFTEGFDLNKEAMQTLLQLVNIKDKQQRIAIQALFLFKMRRQTTTQQLDALCNALQSYSKIVKYFVIRVFADMYKQKILRNASHYEKIVNAVAYALVDSGDKRIIKMALNFMTNTDQEEEIEDEDDEDGPRIVVTDEDRELEIAKLMTKIKRRVSKFSLDYNRKKKDIDAMRKQIVKLNNKMEQENRQYLYIIDYLRDPQSFAEKLVKKFLSKESPFKIKLIIFNYVAYLSERYELIVPQYYALAAKYLRPRQVDVKEIISAVVYSVNPQTPVDDALIVIQQLLSEFIHSGSTDEEVTVAITAITAIAKRLPDVFSGDNGYILNELIGYSRGGDVGSGADGRGAKTSARTRRGVINASRELLNFYREHAPGLLEKRFLNKEAALRLYQQKRLATGVEAGGDADVADLESESSSAAEEAEEKPSKHQLYKRRQEIQRIFGILKHCRVRGKTLTDEQIEEFSTKLGYDIDRFGNKVEYKQDALVKLPDDWEREAIEETFEFEEEEFEEDSDSRITLDQEESEEYDPNVPIEQQRLLTESELNDLRERREQQDRAFDIDEFVTKAKMTSEQRRALSKQSKDHDSHKSNFWNRKADGKSKTNKEKQANKPMLMVLHSRSIKRKQNRSGREKEYVMRTHMRNQKRGITKKVKV